MNWTSWSEFFQMGGYAFYVWSSVVVTFVLMSVELAQIKRARKVATLWIRSNAGSSSRG